MAVFRMDAEAVTGYARTVDDAADEFDCAASGLQDGSLTVETFGELGRQLGLVESYDRAASALRLQLTNGSAALRSASEALHKVTEQHGGGDSDAAAQIKKVGGL